MNTLAHRFSLFFAIGHLIIGLPEVFLIGPRFLPPSWVVIYDALAIVSVPWWLWPGLFVLAGTVALSGMWNPVALRLGFRLSSLCFLFWGIAGVFSLSAHSGGNVPGSVSSIMWAGAGWVLSSYVRIGQAGNLLSAQIDSGSSQAFQAEDERKANGSAARG